METEASQTNKIQAKSRIVFRVEYACFLVLLRLFKSIPLRASYWMAERLVTCLYWSIPRLRKRVQENIETCFGSHYTEAEKADLYADFLKYHAWFWVDMLAGPSQLADRKVEGAIELEDALQTIESASHDGRNGVLLVSSHQGSPDLITLVLGSQGHPVAAIARTIDNPYIRKAVAEERKAFPRIELPKAGGLRPAFRHLSRNGIVGLQIDQDAGPKGLFVPYFGKLASTHSGAGMLAALADCPVLMVYAIRTQPRRFAFKLFVEPLEAPEDLGDTDANVLEWTRLMTESIERMARRFPEQVLWPHRRWKSRPPEDDGDSAPRAGPTRPPPNKLANRPFSLDRRGAK